MDCVRCGWFLGSGTLWGWFDSRESPPAVTKRRAREERLQRSWSSSWRQSVAPNGSRSSIRVGDRDLPIGGLLIALGLALFFPAAGAVGAGTVGLDAKPSRSTDGVYQLSWQSTGEVVLEEARDPGFTDSRIVYRGRDQATTLTGRRDGVYYYRLSPAAGAPAAGAGASSEDGRPAAGAERSAIPVQVRVEHHSLLRALGVFAVGLAVFAATVRLVLAGAEEAGPAERPEGDAHEA